MNTKDFIRSYAMANNVTIKDSKVIVKSVINHIAQVVFKEGQDLNLLKLGLFRHKKRKGKNLRHPGTGEMMSIPDWEEVVFKVTYGEIGSDDEET